LGRFEITPYSSATSYVKIDVRLGMRLKLMDKRKGYGVPDSAG